LLPGSAHPGQRGNIVLAGHRDTFFWPLQDIERGDQIRIVLPQQTYRYRVDSIRVVDPAETSALASKGVEELTLVTCYPFRYVGPAPRRFIVSATRLD
jgi:sortase A